MKQKIWDTIDRYREEILRCGEFVLQHAELGFKEYETSRFVQQEFEKLGIPYEKELAITGVKGTVKIDETPVHICVIGEMDAVKCFDHPTANPETGAAHACGHNAQIASMLGAAYGLLKSDVRKELCGTVSFFAVPAEEFVELEYREHLRAQGKIGCLSGKQELLRIGAFDGIDVAMMIHSQAGTLTPEVYLDGTSLGFVAKKITFKGKAAHGSAPFDGVNALNAAMIALVGINANRETFRDEDRVRIHPIITNGGDLVNVVPDHVVIETYVRGATNEAIADACRKVDHAVQAGALAVGAECIIEDMQGYMPLKQNVELGRVMEESAAQLVGAERVHHGFDMTGSTDMGDLSMVLPCLHPTMGGFTGKAHGADFAVSDPEIAYVDAAKLLAGTVYDLLKDGAARARQIMEEKQ